MSTRNTNTPTGLASIAGMHCRRHFLRKPISLIPTWEELLRNLKAFGEQLPYGNSRNYRPKKGYTYNNYK